MKDEKRITMSKQNLARAQIVELGKILFNIQIVAALIFASPLPFIIYPIYYAFLILISVFTGFTIFVAYPKFAKLWKPSKLYSMLSSLIGTWKITVPIVIGISLLSILCLCFDKNNKHLKRIITSIVVIVFVLAYLILRISISNFWGFNK